MRYKQNEGQGDVEIAAVPRFFISALAYANYSSSWTELVRLTNKINFSIFLEYP